MSFTVIDWVFSGIILIFAIGGVVKGFIDNVFGKIAFIAGIILAWLFYKDIAEKLKASLGTKVSVSGKGDGAGKIEIEFFSNDELDRLVAKIK